MRRVIRILGCSVALSCMSLLTACNTVQGTVQGAGKDMQAVSKAVNPPAKRMHAKTDKIQSESMNPTTEQSSSNEPNPNSATVNSSVRQTTSSVPQSTNQPVEKDTPTTEETY